MAYNPASDHPILTVSQLSFAIKHCLESTFPLIWLQGEISNCKPHTSGHLYFCLKDANAQISAVMFRLDATSLKIVPKDGTQVLVRGEINVYPQSGKYQIMVREMRPIGLGELLLKLEELKIKLHKKGWFRSERKRPLPRFPKRIGVVTSPTGAAIQDILNILTRRYSGFHLILNPVRVQGDGAAHEIAQAIDDFNRYKLVDVMIVGRGGGSIEDLWAFNEEVVAEAILNSQIPIISAVGHETDHCISDYVADMRAPTPSAAAELVISEKSLQLTYLEQTRKRLLHTVSHLIRQDRQRMKGLLRHPQLQSPYALLGQWIHHNDDLRQNIDEAILRKIELLKLVLENKKNLLLSLKPDVKMKHFREKLRSLEKAFQTNIEKTISSLRISLTHFAGILETSWLAQHAYRKTLCQLDLKRRQLHLLSERLLAIKKEQLEQVRNSLHSINPKNLLTKGYSILFSEKNNCAITSIYSTEKEQPVRILLSDGQLLATINDIKPSE